MTIKLVNLILSVFMKAWHIFLNWYVGVDEIKKHLVHIYLVRNTFTSELFSLYITMLLKK